MGDDRRGLLREYFRPCESHSKHQHGATSGGGEKPRCLAVRSPHSIAQLPRRRNDFCENGARTRGDRPERSSPSNEALQEPLRNPSGTGQLEWYHRRFRDRNRIQATQVRPLNYIYTHKEVIYNSEIKKGQRSRAGTRTRSSALSTSITFS